MGVKKHYVKCTKSEYLDIKKNKALFINLVLEIEYREGDYLLINHAKGKNEDEVERKIGKVFRQGKTDIYVMGFDFKHLTKQDRPTKANLEKRKQSFGLKLKPFVIENGGKYPRNMVNIFFEWWTEHGENDHKMRYEKRDSFEISRRLATWYRKAKENGETSKELGIFKK